MRAASIAVLIVVAGAGVFLGGCEETGPPVIVRINGNLRVNAADSSEYSCDAWDWGLLPVTRSWEATRGRIRVIDTAYEVMWYAPDSAGPVSIVAAVTDEDGLTTRDSVEVKVSAVTRKVVDYWGAVKATLFREWRDSLRYGYSLAGEFTVADTHRLSFLVLDDSNYQCWLEGQECRFLVELEQVAKDTFTVGVPAAGVYHFVMDNSHGKRDEEFHLVLRTKSP